MEKPLVSVVMPVYNGERYIGKAIESALGQEVPVEVLVIDDCSADGTELAVMKYMDSGKIRYIQNEQNMGAARSRNRGHHSEQATYKNVPMTEPETEPMPPMTTIGGIS